MDFFFFWKVPVCELFKDTVDITEWSYNNGVCIPNCDTLPSLGVGFLAL